MGRPASLHLDELQSDLLPMRGPRKRRRKVSYQRTGPVHSFCGAPRGYFGLGGPPDGGCGATNPFYASKATHLSPTDTHGIHHEHSKASYRPGSDVSHLGYCRCAARSGCPRAVQAQFAHGHSVDRRCGCGRRRCRRLSRVFPAGSRGGQGGEDHPSEDHERI